MSLKHFADKFLSYTDSLTIRHSQPYHVQFEAEEMWRVESDAGVLQVVGMGTKFHDLRFNYAASLSNCPERLLVRKISPKGVASKQVFVLPFMARDGDRKGQMYASNAVRSAFWSKFPSMESYAIYDRHQLEIAKDNVSQFHGRGWSRVSMPAEVEHWMNHNRHFHGLYDDATRKREDALLQARNRILELQGIWFKDDNMAGAFGALRNSLQVDAELGTLAGACTEVQRMLAKISKVEQHIAGTPRLGLDFTDFLELREAKDELKHFVRSSFEVLPKNSMGLVDYAGIRRGSYS